MGDPVREPVRAHEPLRVFPDEYLVDEGRAGQDKIRNDPGKRHNYEDERSQCRS